jgi:hypothetical protein
MNKKLMFWLAGTPQANLLTNLVSYWKFDADANDALGTNNGTLVGSPGSVAGIIGNCYYLQFSTQYITLLDSASLSFGNAGTDTAFSMQFWIKPDAIGSTKAVFHKRTNASPNFEYQFDIITTGKFQLTMYSAGASTAYIAFKTATSIVAGAWNHIVFTYSGNKAFSGFKCYINGVSDSLTDLSSGVYAGMNAGASIASFGTASYSLGTNPIAGYMDECGLWSKELTQAHVTRLYGAGAGLAYSSFS